MFKVGLIVVWFNAWVESPSGELESMLSKKVSFAKIGMNGFELEEVMCCNGK